MVEEKEDTLECLGLSDKDYTELSDAELFGYSKEDWGEWLDFQRWGNDEEYDNFVENIKD